MHGAIGWLGGSVVNGNAFGAPSTMQRRGA